MPERVMAHLVAGYPDMEASLEVARGLLDGGCAYLEVQFPFSDPTADGPLIQEACDTSLRAGFRLDRGFEFVRQVRSFAQVPLFLMSYANPVVVRGVAAFLRQAQEAGVAGIIVPDLPVDCDEGLYAEARALGLEAVPVAAPNISDGRLQKIAETGSRYVYAALRPGITGERTEIGTKNLAFLRRLGRPARKLLAGFGVSARDQVLALAPHVHAVVVGSAFIQAIREAASAGSRAGDIRRVVKARMRELAGGAGTC
jgi:tryptophan synthase alpha chain